VRLRENAVDEMSYGGGELGGGGFLLSSRAPQVEEAAWDVEACMKSNVWWLLLVLG